MRLYTESAMGFLRGRFLSRFNNTAQYDTLRREWCNSAHLLLLLLLLYLTGGQCSCGNSGYCHGFDESGVLRLARLLRLNFHVRLDVMFLFGDNPAGQKGFIHRPRLLLLPYLA